MIDRNKIQRLLTRARGWPGKLRIDATRLRRSSKESAKLASALERAAKIVEKSLPKTHE